VITVAIRLAHHRSLQPCWRIPYIQVLIAIALPSCSSSAYNEIARNRLKTTVTKRNGNACHSWKNERIRKLRHYVRAQRTRTRTRHATSLGISCSTNRKNRVLRARSQSNKSLKIISSLELLLLEIRQRIAFAEAADGMARCQLDGCAIEHCFCGAHRATNTSTRRFFCRPSSVSLQATGRTFPNPSTCMSRA
jgi:hypothetical protein